MTYRRFNVFEESDGFHWDCAATAKRRGFLDARGPAFRSREAAMQAIDQYLADPLYFACCRAHEKPGSAPSALHGPIGDI